MSNTRTITAKYAGTCNCGARFAAGARVRWISGTGVTTCPACSLKIIRRDTVNGYSVSVLGNADGDVLKVNVLVGSAEIAPAWMGFYADGTMAPLGGHNGMHNMDIMDFFDDAKSIARDVFKEALAA